MRRALSWKRGAIGKTVIASFAVHALVLGLSLARRTAAALVHVDPVEETALRRDDWAGTTAEVLGSPFVDVGLEGPAGAAREATSGAEDGTPAAATTPPAPTTPPVTRKQPAPPVTGAAAVRSTPAAEPPTTKRPASNGSGRRRPRSSAAATEGGDDASRDHAKRGGSFGAEGPGSPRDLDRAFARAIAPACQQDSVWSSLAAGDAGSIDVAVRVDADGHLAEFAPAEAHPPKQLAALLKRTFAVLEAGTFALRAGVVDAGSAVLRIHAVTSDEAEDDVAGGAVALGHRYEGGRWKATFLQAGGRRVEVSVQLLRVEVAPSRP